MNSVQVDPNPFLEGNEAFARGVTRDSCPYPSDGDARHEWLAGWDEAARYAAKNGK